MKEKHLYENLKEKLLKAKVLSSNLTEKAKIVKEEDSRYDREIEAINDYLLQQMNQGDSIAYALYRTATSNENKVIDIEKNLYGENYIKFFKTLENYKIQSPDQFFDFNVVYIANQLAGESPDFNDSDL